MRLADLIENETQIKHNEIVLLRHFNSIDRFLELGGTIEEFTFLQPVDSRWDFWKDGAGKPHILVVIVHDKIHSVQRINEIEATGRFEKLSSDQLKQFDRERKLFDPEKLTRKYSMTPVKSKVIGSRISGWEGKEINAILRSNSKLFWEIEVEVPAALHWPADADADQSTIDLAEYVPSTIDLRRVIERQIRERRGQQEFREALRKRYGDCCLISRCEVLAVLEAAHINPYRNEADHRPENGLLLRADIHTLFDLDLLGIEPVTLHIELHPSIASSHEYAPFRDIALYCRSPLRPSVDALKLRYEQYLARLQQP